MADSDPPQQPPGTAVDDGKGRMFPCEGCGADLTFHIGQQQLKCPYCGFEKALQFADDAEVVEQDFDAMLDRMRGWHDGDRHDEAGQSEVKCASCAGTVVFQGSLTSSECPYCGSPIQRDKIHDAEQRVPVDGVLPFLIERRRAERNLADWVQSRWFAPGEFRKRGVQGRFNGIYLPFWTFDSATFSRYSGERGEHYWVTVKGPNNTTRSERRTRWYPASGSFEHFFDDVLIRATTGLPDKLLDRLEPWPLVKLVPFNQELLAGYLARTYEVELPAGFKQARAKMQDVLRAQALSRIGGDTQRLHRCDSTFNAVTFKHLLMPVWMLAYRYNDKAYQVMVNAATGEVQGERPWSVWKITGLVLLIAAVVAVIAIVKNLR